MPSLNRWRVVSQEPRTPGTAGANVRVFEDNAMAAFIANPLFAIAPALVFSIAPQVPVSDELEGVGASDMQATIHTAASSGDAAATKPVLTRFARDYASAWSSQNPASVAAFFSETGQLAINGGRPATGRAAIAEVARGFMEAFPDMVVALDRLEPNGERVLFHWTLTGTNTGPGGTGAPVRISGVEAWLVGPNGLIADSDGSFDAEDYERQLGASRQDEHGDLMPILESRTRVILDGIRSDDVAPIMALYAPGSLYSSDNTTLLSDPEEIEAFWINVAASPAHDATLEVLRIERLGPDAFVEIQKYDVFDARGARLFGGYASLLWRRIEGRWLIVADVSN